MTGTLIRDIVEFEVGWWQLGQLCDVRGCAQVQGRFRYCQRALPPALLKNQEKR